jgi:hypothetical protein
LLRMDAFSPIAASGSEAVAQSAGPDAPLATDCNHFAAIYTTLSHISLADPVAQRMLTATAPRTAKIVRNALASQNPSNAWTTFHFVIQRSRCVMDYVVTFRDLNARPLRAAAPGRRQADIDPGPQADSIGEPL